MIIQAISLIDDLDK